MGIGILDPWPEWFNRLVRRYRRWRDADRNRIVELLRSQGEMSSLDIVIELDGNLYPTLRAMAADGVLVRRYGPPVPERGGKPRVYYSLPSGTVPKQGETPR